MDIKLNKNLQVIQDRAFFGLTMRQAICGGAGLAIGVAIYLTASKSGLPSTVITYIMLPAVAPFVALGFVTYNGLFFEDLIKVFIRQFLLCPKVLVSHLENSFYVKDSVKINKAEQKEVLIND